MHLRALLSLVPQPRSLAWRIFSATGFRTTIPIFVVSAATMTVYRNGKIEHLGPLAVQPAIPVILMVPVLLSIACGLAHSTWSPPVIGRNARVHLIRFGSYATALAISIIMVAVGTRLGAEAMFSGTLRNLLVMAGATITTTALIGITYAWVPVVLLAGAGILSASTEEPWTMYGMLFHHEATAAQTVFALLCCAMGLTLGVWDPVSRGYLKPARQRP